MSDIRMVGPSLAMDSDLFYELQRSIREEMDRSMRLPDHFFKLEPMSISAMTRDKLATAVTRANTQLESAAQNLAQQMIPVMQNTIRSLHGLTVRVSELLPKHREWIGHTFNGDIKPSKHRSKRVWKKLRYGTRKNPRLKPLYRETEQAFVLPGGRVVASPAIMRQMAILRGL